MGVAKKPRKTTKNPNPNYVPPASVAKPARYRRLRVVDRDYLARLCDARDTLCGYCSGGICEVCGVNMLIDDAFNELSEVEVECDA